MGGANGSGTARDMAEADSPAAAAETAEAILQAVAGAGQDLSSTQLVRLHQHGLIARPAQVSRGEGGGRGKVTVYPAGTTDLVIGLCRLRQPGQSFDELGWSAWWNNLSVPDKLAHRYLQKLADGIVAVKERVLTAEGELTDEADEAIDAMREAQLENMPMRWVRRRVGTKDFDVFLARMADVLAGRVSDLDASELELLEHGIGMDRARTDRLAATGRPWLDSDPRQDFEAISQRVDPHSLAKAAGEISDEQLREARDKARAFVAVISGLGMIMRATGDRWSYGYAAFGAIFDDMCSTPRGQAQFMLFFLSCVAADGTEGIDQIISQAPQVAQAVRQFEAIKALREAVPEVGEAVSMQMLGRAMADAGYQAQLNAKFTELRKTCGEKIDQFFAAHPDYLTS